jgi:hypothetical protein
MNPNQKDNSEINSGTIDGILAEEETLAPTSGFLASVMERVHEEAHTPALIPFPWKRALPGILLASGVFGWGAFEFAQQALPAVRTVSFSTPQLSSAVERPLEQAGWVALALGVSLVSWLLSRRLAGQSGDI